MKCQNCGTVNNPEFKFCMTCGKSLSDTLQVPAQPEPVAPVQLEVVAPVVEQTPVMPQVPVEPVIPAQPEVVTPVVEQTPVMPQVPVEPVAPVQPEVVAPVVEQTPVMPQVPVEPVAPAQPEVVTPVVEQTPVMPQVPVEPLTPVQPEVVAPVVEQTPVMSVEQLVPSMSQVPVAETQNANSYNNSTPQKKINFKKILLIIIAIAAVALGAFIVMKIFGKDKLLEKQLNSIFDPKKPIVIKENGKYGYITSNGKIMIKPKYNYANDFYGDYAVVVVDNQDKEDSYNEELYQIIDKKGNVKMSSDSYDSPKYYVEYDLWVIDDVLYNSKLKPVLAEGITVDYIDNGYFTYENSEKSEVGIITYDGKNIFSMKGTSIFVDISTNEYDDEELYAVVKSYSDPEQEFVISLKTGKKLFTSKDPENYYLMEDENGVFHYYNHNATDGYQKRKYLYFRNDKLAYESNEILYELEVYDHKKQILEIDYGYNYDELGKEKRIYYYDVKNKKMLSERPEVDDEDEMDMIEKTYGFKEFASSGKYGLMSGEKIVIPAEYDDIDYLNVSLFKYMQMKGKELVLLEDDEKTLLYDVKKSKTIKTFDSNYIYDYYDSTFVKISLYDDDSYYASGYMYYNLLSGKSITFDADDSISIGSNYIYKEESNKRTYYNTDLKEIYVSKK